MTDIDYIGADELVFNTDVGAGIYSGGFSVNSIMMKGGMSPIITLNNEINTLNITGGANASTANASTINASTVNASTANYSKVSDIFNNLVVPNWALTYNNRMVGGSHKHNNFDHKDTDSEEDYIEDDLHDKLIELIKDDERLIKGEIHTVKKRMLTRRPKRLIKEKSTRRSRK
jgi:hypothetical protein